MAHTKSARKRVRQNTKRQLGNRRRRAAVKKTIRAFNDAVSAGQADQAGETLKKVYKLLDATAARGTMHKNAVARRKSRLARQLSQLTAK